MEINLFNMHIVRKIVFAALILLGLIFFGIWGLGKVGGSVDAELEAVFPEDASMVMVFDYSDSGQRAALKNLIKKFPETGGWERIVKMIDDYWKEEDISYKKNIESVIEKKWEIGIAVNLEEVVKIENADLVGDTVENSAENPVEIYFAGKFAQAQKVQKFFEKTLIKNYGENYEGYEEHDDFKYWNPRPDDDFYLVRYGDLFFATNTEQYRDAAVERIKNNSGFKPREGESLMYTYLNLSNWSAMFEALFRKSGLEDIADSVENIGTEYSNVAADEGGLKFYGEAEVDLSEGMEDEWMNYDYEVGLYKKIGGDNVMLYSEQSKLGMYFKIIVQNFMMGFNSASIQAAQGSDIPQELFIPNYYENFVGQLARISELSTEDVETLLQRPLAFAILNNEDILPSVIVAIDVREENSENAKKLINGVDSFVSDVIVDYEALMANATGGEIGMGVFKKERIVMGGGSFYKIWFDESALSEEALARMNLMGLSIKDFDLELYFGVTGDGLMIFAFYPNFEEAYGKSSLTENEDFVAALEKISSGSGYKIDYMNGKEIADFLHRGFEKISYKNLLVVPIRARYEQYIEPILKTCLYLISSERVDNGIIKADGYLKIGS